MLRVSEKLRDFFHKRLMGRFAWLRFLLIMLILGNALAFALHHALTVRDTQEVRSVLDESFSFVKTQLVKYDNYVAVDKAKSLVRLMDKANEAARVLRDEPDFGEDGLEAYVAAQRLTGVLVLDEKLNAALETASDGDTRAMWQSLIESDNVANILQYPAKSYLTRTTVNGQVYDVAAVARQDQPGVVLAYAGKYDITDANSDVTLANLFTGFKFNMDGVVVVVRDDQVVATNSPMLAGLSRDAALALSTKEYARDKSGLYSVSRGSKTWLGDQRESEEYMIYVFFPESTVYATRRTIMGVAMTLFVLIWMGFIVLRSVSERAILEQSQKRLNTINALSKAYTSMYVVQVPSGEMECIVNPNGSRDLSCKNVAENTRQYVNQYIDPKDRGEMEAFLDLSTVEKRLKGKRYISHTYRSNSGRWYYSMLVAQSRDKKGRLTAIDMLPVK